MTRSFASEPRIRAGTEVLSINGVPVDAVLRRLMTVARADGGNDAKRRSDLEVQGANRWEAFDIFFPLLFPSPSPRMALRVLTAPGERVTALEVDPLTYEQRLATMATSRDPSGGEDAPAWDLRFLDVRTACRQPTGGNQRGINGGAFFFLRLPRSGLELDLPLIGQFSDGERPDAGLEPDVLVVPTVSDIAGGRDAELEAVRARIAAGGG